MVKNVEDKPPENKMTRNLQAEVSRIVSVKNNIEELEYISPSETKRLLFEVEALRELLKSFID